MEEEITVSESFLLVECEYCNTNILETITTYDVMSYNRGELPFLSVKQIQVLTTGSSDIGENFQRLVEKKLEDRLAIMATRNGMSAVKVLDELVKVSSE